MIPSPGISTFSGDAAGNIRHSAYSLRHATVAYPWHPLFGVTVQVAHHRRGKQRQLKAILSDLPPGYSREAPNWMFDASFCAGMASGSPEVCIESLQELAELLAALGETRRRHAPSSSSNAKERRGAEKKLQRSKAVQTRSGRANTAVLGAKDEGVGGSPCRPSSRGDGTSIVTDLDGQGGR